MKQFGFAIRNRGTPDAGVPLLPINMRTEYDNPDSLTSMGTVVFQAGERRFAASDIVDAAWFRGDLQSLWQEFLLGIACEGRAEEEGLEADSDALQSLSEDIRYNNNLITAEETEEWLRDRGMTLDDLGAYACRRYWRESPAAPAPPADLGYPDAEEDLRELFIQDLLFAGELVALARCLSAQVAGSTGSALRAAAVPERMETVRAEFFRRTLSTPGRLSEWLGRLGRDEAWFESMVELESVYVWRCEQFKTPENRARTLAVLRLPLTRFEIETLDLESEDAVREACLCLNVDGLSMEELAGQEHCRTEMQKALLEDFPEALQQRFLSSENGRVIVLSTAGERFQICRILNKQEPSLDDEMVLARVDAELLSGHFGNLVSTHITWLIGPDSSA